MFKSKIIGQISTSTQCFVIFTSLFSIIPYAHFIYRNSDDVVFSTVFFLGYHIFMMSMNVIRQGVPYTIYYWSEKNNEIKEKIVLNKEEVVVCFCEIFYEKSFLYKPAIHVLLSIQFDDRQNVDEHDTFRALKY